MQKLRKTLNILTIFGLIAVTYLAIHIARKPDNHIITLGTPKILENVLMSDDTHASTSLEQYRGKWVMMFFGYMSCPDVCPTSMAFIANEMKHLESLYDNLQVIFVSVDPERDNVVDLGNYVRFFDNRFVAWTGRREDIDFLVKQVGAYYKKEESTSAMGYLISHTADFYLINPKGEWQGVYRPPLKNGVLAANLKQLIERTPL